MIAPKSHTCSECGKRTTHKVYAIDSSPSGWREVQIGWSCKCGAYDSVTTHESADA